ncbi:MAG: hypothetical protein LBQ73_11555, partial [Tannerellaceae bacterium]|nr:hypothetical protein [Tannerellaceae bacterium]
MALLAATAACTSPETPVDITPEGRKAVILLAPPASRANGGTLPLDDRVKYLRVMVFNEHDGSLAHNKFTDNLSGDYKVEMMTGKYDFVFIANERPESASSNAPISMKLNQVRTFRDLENIGFTSRDINESNLIPMVSIYTDVTVDGNNKLSGYDPDANPFSVTGSTWSIEVKRAAIRVDLTLKTASADMANDFSRISISNLPDEVPLLGSVYSRASFDSPKVIALGKKFQQNASGGWELKYDRIILPASDIKGADASNAITFSVRFNNYPDLQGTLTDGAAPRNRHYELIGTLNEKLNFKAEVKEWKQLSIIPQWLYVDSMAPLYTLNGKKHRIRIHAEYDWTVESGDRTYLEIEADSSSGKRGRNQWISFNLERTYSNYFDQLDSMMVSLVFHSQEGGQKTVELPAVTFPRFSANSYMVKPNGQQIDILLTNINHPDILSTLNLASPRLKDNEDFDVKLLWQDTPGVVGSSNSCIKQIDKMQGTTVNSSYIRVTGGDVEGNAVIVITKKGSTKILWSWHIWVTHYNPDAITPQQDGENHSIPANGSLYKHQNYLYMDRFLGAIFTPGNDGSPTWIKSQDYSENNMTTAKLLTKASGYYYQWGRKDPILTLTVTNMPPQGSYKTRDTPVYDAMGQEITISSYILMSNGIDTSIENPLRVMNYSFFREARSWGTSKSKNIFDPCPEGWRVPHSP